MTTDDDAVRSLAWRLHEQVIGCHWDAMAQTYGGCAIANHVGDARLLIGMFPGLGSHDEKKTPDLPPGSPEAALSHAIEVWAANHPDVSLVPFCADGAALSIMSVLSEADWSLLRVHAVMGPKTLVRETTI